MSDPVDALTTTPAMAAIWSAEAHVRGMLAFEGALALAEARAGVIPMEGAEAIRAACRVETFDVAALYREAASAGTPAIPLVRMLTERVEPSARGYVHWGATSQDVIDTALVLQMRDGLGLLRARLLVVAALCAALAERYRATPMVGRTLLQQALPITFGLKAARWLALATRQAQRLAEVHARIAVVQLGGAAGTLAALGAAGPRVTAELAAELGLAPPDLPWHTERDRVAEVAAALAVLAGAMAKIAHDLTLLAQSEVGEVAEAAAPGKGGSSAMPQKRNPVNAMLAQAAARLALGVAPVILSALPQEHERAVGGWQAEWEALPRLFRYTAGAVERTHDALDGLEVDTAAMRANLDRSHGLIMAEALTMALAPQVGRPEAFRLVRTATERARTTGAELRDVALADAAISAALSAEAITQAFDPAGYLGSADHFIDRALADYRALLAAGV
ncbi:MAG TPA: 3-carboxy-cis,cis-muconate cycloisomerase [Ktedonobacterales bacterium]